MAASLIGGLIANGFEAGSITACDINDEQLRKLLEKFSIHTSTDNVTPAEQADVVLLAVKPQLMQVVCEQLAILDRNNSRLFISIAAGVRESDINRWLGGSRCVIRCMPNTPSLIQLGATGLYANQQVSEEQKHIAQTILDAVGISVWVNEEVLLDAVTAVSGSGPAYFFYFIELLQSAGEKLGLDTETARKLALQTALGASHMARQDDVVDLRARVTSKKGTTEQAILSFQNNNLASLVQDATKAAYDRSAQLAEELANND